MGTLTLAELKEELKAGLRNRNDLDLRLTRFLNLAQQRLARVSDFDELEVISTSTLPFANTFRDKYIVFPQLREIYAFKVIQGTRSKRIVQRSSRWFNRHIPAPQEQARRDSPDYYTLWGNSAVIWPMANAADIPIEVWHTIWPDPFTDGDLEAKSKFDAKDDVLVGLALVYAFNSLGKTEDAQTHWESVRGKLLEAVESQRTNPDLDIHPTPGEEEDQLKLPQEYWNDPFTREVW